MKLGLLLSGENYALSKAEAESILGKAKGKKIVIVNARKPILAKRLAFTRIAFEVLFESKLSNLDKSISNFNWNKHCKGTFSVRILNLSNYNAKAERYYGGLVWQKLKNPRVELNNPTTQFQIVFAEGKAFGCKVYWQNQEDFEARKAHKRPGFLPISLHPKLAKGCVNLLGMKCKKFIDPFCGSGGFLIEGALLGLKTEGWDISTRCVNSTKDNLKFFKKKAIVKKQDALTLGKVNYLITDLPYGRSTKLDKELYEKFFSLLRKKLNGTAVVMIPSTAKIPKGFKGKYFDYYIHKSLTKRILILRK